LWDRREELAVRVYLEAMRMSYRRYCTYGAATIAGLLTNAFFGLLRSYIFISFYHQRPVAEGYDLGDALTYVWLTQGLIMPLYLWGWLEIADTIRSGAIALDLSKPISYYGFWLSRDLGRAGYHILFRWLPTIALGLILFHIRLPGSPLAWLAFAISFLLAIILSFCLRFMINVVGFWTTDVRGIMGMVLLFVNFLTGFLVPLEFFPPALRAIVTQLPFAGIISIPVNVFLEQAQGTDLLILLARQVFWAIVFVGAAQLLLRAATRKLVVQGG
jgi:ABC-2 type transport system permease protein